MINTNELRLMSSAIRMLSADAVQQANSGHPGMPLGMADTISVLFKYFIRFNPADPTWINRDRFIISAGHGSMLLYSILYLTGYHRWNLDIIKNFRQIHSLAAGHPEKEVEAGIEVTTGPLGHGVSMAVGQAIASKKLATQHPQIINNKIYVVVGDGCLMEGISYEALALAGNLQLNNLVIIWDNNNITIDGEVSLASREDQRKRFEANGFLFIDIDGHCYQEIYDALARAQEATSPVLIAAKTRIGFGAPTKEGKNSCHGAPLGASEIEGLRTNLAWEHPPFEIPDSIKQLWEAAGARTTEYYNEWVNTYNNYNQRTEIEQFFDKASNVSHVRNDIQTLANKVLNERPSRATRLSSLDVIEVLASNLPGLLGGSADLSHSVMTKASTAVILDRNNYNGNYINYGIREHAMGAVINGLAAYGGFIPYGGTFLVFSDFLRPSVRLAALQQLQSIFVLTHDSIGVGEDGPTHQPIEHLASLRLIPNVDVIRPCDGIETIEAWLIALNNFTRPTCLLFSRQNLPTLRYTFNYEHNLTARGGYILFTNINNQLLPYNYDQTVNQDHMEVDINLIASGSEVSLATEVSKALGEQGISSKVISMPSLNLFKLNTPEYINSVIGSSKLNVIIEAAVINGYSSVLDTTRLLTFGINTFGHSGKASDIYNYFGLTTQNIVDQILLRIRHG